MMGVAVRGACECVARLARMLGALPKVLSHYLSICKLIWIKYLL